MLCNICNFLYAPQILQSWLTGLPDDFPVKDFINELNDWVDDEYVKETVWKRLPNCVSPGVLPTFSERRSARKRSGSSSPDSEKKAASSSGRLGVFRKKFE